MNNKINTKERINITIDKEIYLEAKLKNINFSNLCNAALKNYLTTNNNLNENIIEIEQRITDLKTEQEQINKEITELATKLIILKNKEIETGKLNRLKDDKIIDTAKAADILENLGRSK